VNIAQRHFRGGEPEHAAVAELDPFLAAVDRHAGRHDLLFDEKQFTCGFIIENIEIRLADQVVAFMQLAAAPGCGIGKNEAAATVLYVNEVRKLIEKGAGFEFAGGQRDVEVYLAVSGNAQEAAAEFVQRIDKSQGHAMRHGSRHPSASFSFSKENTRELAPSAV
jgi:hypothetical protein